MKSISREAVLRWFNGESVGAGGGVGFDPSMISGLAQQSWVKDNFVSIEFFGRLFKAYGPGENQGDPDVEVLPNDMDSTISNIEAMFGFWTDFYLTALGNGGEIGASIYLAGLADVNVAGVQTGQVLTWNAATNKWIATTPQSGVDMNQVWNALAAQTSQQINASHLSTALADYATQTWVGQQGYITSSGSCAYATNAGTATYATSAGSAQSAGYASSIPQHSLWGQTFDGTQDVNGDIAMNNNSRIYNTTASGGSLYIGRSNDEGWVKLSDVCSRQGDSYWKIYSSGDATFANVYSNGAMTCLSDQREKNIIENFEVSLKYIADAPVVSYTWKDKRRGDKQHIGSIAQYWLREMPELVPEVNGRYTMDYGRIALLCAILIARYVVNLIERITRLEKTLRGE